LNASHRPSLLPVIIGISLAGALILVLGFWVSRRQPTSADQPRATLDSPARDTTITGPLQLEFRTEPPIRIQPTGWGTGRHHLHVLVNGVERMPAATDIEALGDTAYSWTLTGLPDSADVQLVWALPNHQRLTAGSSQPVRVHTRRRP
jgi:hypothetical protein